MKSESALKNLVIAGLFIVPFLVIPVTSTFFFPFITGKNFLFRIIVEIIFAAWAVLALKDPAYRPRRSPLLFIYAAFMIILTLADFGGAHPYRSFWSNAERMEGLVAHLHFFAYFVMLASMFKTEKLWRAWINTSIGVSVYESLYALVQLAGLRPINQGGVRVDGTFGNAIYFAVYLLFHIYFCAIMAARTGTTRAMRFAYGAIALVEIGILYNTATRGAILGFLGSLVVISVVLLFRMGGRVRQLAAAALIAVVFLTTGFYFARNTNFVQSSPVLRRFTNITSETTVLSRRYIYPLSFQGFKENPVLGWGQENYNIVFNKYYDPHLYAQEQWFDRSHNVFLDWLIAAGSLGLISYLGLFGAAIYLLMRADHMPVIERVLFLGLLSAYFAQNLTVFDNLTSYLFFFAVLAHIHFHGTWHIPDQQRESHLVGTTYGPQLVALAVLLPVLYVVNIKPMVASARLIEAIQITSPTTIGQNLEKFKQAIGANTFVTPESREQLVQIAMQVARAGDVPQQDKLAMLEYAREQALRQVDMYPDDARYRLFAGGFFSRVGLNDEGLAQLNEAVKLSPKKQTLMFELANAYINKKEYVKANEILKTAYELEPAFEEARKLYALGLFYEGKIKEAEALLKPLGLTLTVNDDRFIQAFLEKKRYDLVVAVWRQRVAAEPGNARNHLALATSLWADKKYSEARTSLKKASELDPSISEVTYLEIFQKELK